MVMHSNQEENHMSAEQTSHEALDDGKRGKRRFAWRASCLGCGVLAGVLLILMAWIVVPFLSTPSMDTLPPHHPFRSQEARERYLAHYQSRASHWPVPWEERFVETAEGVTFVRISGPVAAPPLVLLPGASTNSLAWRPNIEALSQQFRVYALDNIYDCGLSVYKKAFRTPDDFVAWLDHVFTALYLRERINLAGLSYGGWLSTQYSLKHPERLHKVVLLAPAATLFPLPPDWAWRGILAVIPHRSFLRSFSRWMFVDLSQSDPSLMEEVVDDAWMAIRCFRPKTLVPPTVLSDDELHGIRVPRVILVGEHERLYPAERAVERLNRVAPQIRAEIILGAGHDLTIVQAARVNRRVIDFLIRNEPAGTS
jgi:pimeloyl-ACP methyl ester carboxylesterase